MISADKLDAFAAWLVKENYATATVRKFRSDVATMSQWGTSPPKSERIRPRLADYRLAWARWAEWCKLAGKRNPLPEPELPPRERGRRRSKRLKPALSIPNEQWRALRARVRKAADLPSVVIDVLVCTGKRISDVLGIAEPQLRSAFARKDGNCIILVKGAKPIVFSVHAAPEACERLLERLPKGARVCEVLTPGGTTAAGDAAYQKVRRALKAHAAAVGLDPKTTHLHRTRRTVGVELIRAGASLEEVQRVLDHDSRRTTERYVDEGMTDVATRALQRLNKS